MASAFSCHLAEPEGGAVILAARICLSIETFQPFFHAHLNDRHIEWAAAAFYGAVSSTNDCYAIATLDHAFDTHVTV
jgi:hypothetical protein